jgi:hypothetical protein
MEAKILNLLGRIAGRGPAGTCVGQRRDKVVSRAAKSLPAYQHIQVQIERPAMTQIQAVIDFPDSSEAEQDSLAKSLAQEIRGIDGVSARPRNPDPNSQFGASEIQLVLDTHAIDALAIGIGAWLALRNKTRLRVRRGKDEMDLRNAAREGAIESLKLFLGGALPTRIYIAE